VMESPAERELRAAEAFRRAEALGALLNLNPHVRVADEGIEVVATLADATQTAIVYRAPSGFWASPRPVAPRALMGGSSGGEMAGYRVAHMPPISAEHTKIVVTFGGLGRAGTEIELPIDHTLSQPHERRGADGGAAVVVDGVSIRVLGAEVGVLMATVDLEISAEDPTIADASLGGRSHPTHPHVRAGSGPLWREWFPPDLPSSRSDPVKIVVARRAEGEVADVAPRPMPWTVRSLPDGQPLARHGAMGQGGSTPDSLSRRETLQFDVPAPDATAIEVSLDDLVVFRTCHEEVQKVPAPSLERPVDLLGRSFTCGGEEVVLLRWEPPDYGTATPRLFVRPSSECWPDIRVVVGPASITLWMSPAADGTLVGGLPGAYLPAFTGSDELDLGLRMVGHRLDVAPMVIGLSPPQGTSRS
jgi:hypothetical protein